MKSLLRRLALVSSLLPVAAAATPIEWVVGYAAGGGSDVVARTLAEAMGKTLATTLVVNNKPGAGTNIAAEYAARAKADGQTHFTADFATLAANPSLFSKLGYNAERDFAPVGLMARFPLVLVVGPQVPATNYKEFVAWVKAQKDGAPYASPGAGSPHHLATEMAQYASAERERWGLVIRRANVKLD